MELDLQCKSRITYHEKISSLPVNRILDQHTSVNITFIALGTLFLRERKFAPLEFSYGRARHEVGWVAARYPGTVPGAPQAQWQAPLLSTIRRGLTGWTPVSGPGSRRSSGVMLLPALHHPGYIVACPQKL